MGDQPVINQRHPHFHARLHGHLVGIVQIMIGHETVEFEIEETLDGMMTPRAIKRCPQTLGYTVSRHCITQPRGQKRPPAVRTDGRIAHPVGEHFILGHRQQ